MNFKLGATEIYLFVIYRGVTRIYSSLRLWSYVIGVPRNIIYECRVPLVKKNVENLKTTALDAHLAGHRALCVSRECSAHLLFFLLFGILSIRESSLQLKEMNVQ